MIDLSGTVIPKSDQLNADDFISGTTKFIKITGVRVVSGDQPVIINYEGDNGKPYKPNLGMRRVLIKIWGTDGSAYVGRTLELYNDESVKWAGKEVGGIRIKSLSHMEKPRKIALTIAKGKKMLFEFLPLIIKQEKPIEEMIADAKADLGELDDDQNARLDRCENKKDLRVVYREIKEELRAEPEDEGEIK